MKTTLYLTVAMLCCAGLAVAQPVLKGKVIDRQSKAPIEYAVVHEQRSGKTCITDNQGNFELRIPAGYDTIHIDMVGFRSQLRDVRLSKHPELIELERGPVNLREVTIQSFPNNASFHLLSQIDLNLVALNSSQDLMRLVPGLFLGQHQGGGLAEHIFFRGFDADHGTDVAVVVDDMPLNLPSHAHGQGFADLHCVIPELVHDYEYGKGPYYAEHGDFTTAGYVAFHTRETLEKNEVKIEGGQFHTGRMVAMINLLGANSRAKDQSFFVAGEAAYADGPFRWPQHLSRFNLLAKYHGRLSARTTLTASLATFSSDWRSSGEIPERAVTQGLIGRFGYIDSAQGGYTSRSSAIAKLRTVLSDHALLENQVYYTRYFFNEHYDPTFFAEDPVHGDQLRQRESRDVFGYNGKYVQHVFLKNGAELSTTAGAGWQLNKIYNSELSHTVNYNTVLDYIQLGNITESAWNVFAAENYRSGKWLFTAGMRVDALHFAYFDKINPGQPARGKWTGSPKITAAYTASDRLEMYVKAGKGFHSNDAKAVAAHQGIDILPAAYGADLGINWKPVPRLFVNAALWYLYLQQEFVYDADEGTFDPGGKTSRAGIDLSARYQFVSWLFARFDLNVCRARSVDAAKGDDYLPLAVPLSGTGGLYVKSNAGWNGGIGYRYMKNRPANEDNSLVAKGYFVTDLTAGYTKKRFEIGLEIQNLFNAEWREAQFEVTSRMRQETQAVDGISFTPGHAFFWEAEICRLF